MKSFFLSTLLLVWSISSKCQCSIKINVTDIKLKNPIPYVSIKFINNNIGGVTDKFGIFVISYNCSINDSLEISYLGYEKKIIELNYIKNEINVELIPKENLLPPIILNQNKKREIEVLNKFNHCTSDFYTSNESGAHVAQSFKSNFKISRIKKIKICKARGISNFKIIIYNSDSASNLPHFKLFDTTYVSTEKKKKVSIDLKKSNIILDSANYFVSIQWILSKENEYNEILKVQGKKRSTKFYNPNLCCSRRSDINGILIFNNTVDGWIKYDGAISSFLISVEAENMSD